MACGGGVTRRVAALRQLTDAEAVASRLRGLSMGDAQPTFSLLGTLVQLHILRRQPARSCQHTRAAQLSTSCVGRYLRKRKLDMDDALAGLDPGR